MNTTTLTLMIVVAMAAVLFLLVWGVTTDGDAAKAAAAFALTTLPSISSWLDRVEAKKSSIPENKLAIRSLEGFSISFLSVVSIGTIIGVSIINIGAFFSGMLVGIMRTLAHIPEMATDKEKAELFMISSIANFPIVVVGSYLLGKWVGWRYAKRNGVFAIILIALLMASITRSIDFLSINDTAWLAMFHVEKNINGLFITILPQFAFVFIVLIFGFWRGSRNINVRYIQYLLSILPESAQNALIGMAYDEAIKVMNARRAGAAATVGSSSASRE